MRFYTQAHRHYCGVDLHARTMYVCILDQDGTVLLHRNLPCDAARFLQAIQSYREDLVVAVECLFCWYWLADLCADEGIAFMLGHALYMKAIHQTHREGPSRSAPPPSPLSNWLRRPLRELAEADVSIRTARGHRIVSETLGARGPQHRRGRGG